MKTTSRKGAKAQSGKRAAARELDRMSARYGERDSAISLEEIHLAKLRNEIVQTEKRIAGMKEKQLALGLEITRQIARARR